MSWLASSTLKTDHRAGSPLDDREPPPRPPPPCYECPVSHSVCILGHCTTPRPPGSVVTYLGNIAMGGHAIYGNNISPPLWCPREGGSRLPPPPPPTPPPPTPGAGHLDVVWRLGGVSPPQPDRNRRVASLQRLSTALKIFRQFPVGHPPCCDAGRKRDRVAGTGALSTC